MFGLNILCDLLFYLAKMLAYQVVFCGQFLFLGKGLIRFIFIFSNLLITINVCESIDNHRDHLFFAISFECFNFFVCCKKTAFPHLWFCNLSNSYFKATAKQYQNELKNISLLLKTWFN